MSIINMIELIIIIVIFILLIYLLKNSKNGKKLIISRIAGLFVINIMLIGHLSYGTLLEKPNIHLNGEKNITIEVNNKYVENGAKLKYHNKDLSNKIEIQNNVNTQKLGNYEVLYKFKMNNKDFVQKRQVNVIDITLPIIKLKGKNEVNVPQNSEYVEDGYTAYDNYDGDITKKVTIKKEEINDKQYKLNYYVEDSSNNSTIVTRTINIVEPINEDAKNKAGVIYLTFDDGPSLDITPKILDILKEENIKATFFILNYDKNREFLVKRIINEGHSIGIHGYSHDYAKIYTSVDSYMNNITKLQEKIFKSTGVNTKITRFPGGSSNTISKYYNIGIMSKLTKKILNDGYFYYDWNVSSGDAGGAKTSKDVYNNVISEISKKRANIVLMHDFGGNDKTLNALKDIIQYGKKNGFTFDKIKEDTPMITHKVSN